ncbi:MAG TPA: 50S ribosomal protein L23 [Patescibacteria group bacterium]|nr:50S ribosomal protein L23 [Patescibacteria group bacterium]
MGFLDRFKKQKEQEIGGGVSGESVPVFSTVLKTEPKKKEESVPAKTKPTPRVLQKKAEGGKKSGRVIPAFLSNVLLEPVVSEKTARLASGGTYTFWVQVQATRTQVCQAVTAWYGVRPQRVRLLRSRQEPVRFGKVRGFQKARKKAMVTLPVGKRLDAYEGV